MVKLEIWLLVAILAVVVWGPMAFWVVAGIYALDALTVVIRSRFF